MRIKEISFDEFNDFMKSMSSSVGLRFPTMETVQQILGFLQFNQKHLDIDEIRTAFDYWVLSENNIKSPAYLNSKFIMDIIRFQRTMKGKISNDGLSQVDKPMHFSESEKAELKIEHQKDMREYVNRVFKGDNDTLLNVRSLEICDKQFIDDGIYAEDTFESLEIYKRQNYLQDYFLNRAKLNAPKTGFASGFLKSTQDVTYNAARAAEYLLKYE